MLLFCGVGVLKMGVVYHCLGCVHTQVRAFVCNTHTHTHAHTRLKQTLIKSYKTGEFSGRAPFCCVVFHVFGMFRRMFDAKILPYTRNTP